jgi:hypothetical protein
MLLGLLSALEHVDSNLKFRQNQNKLQNLDGYVEISLTPAH